LTISLFVLFVRFTTSDYQPLETSNFLKALLLPKRLELFGFDDGFPINLLEGYSRNASCALK